MAPSSAMQARLSESVFATEGEVHEEIGSDDIQEMIDDEMAEHEVVEQGEQPTQQESSESQVRRSAREHRPSTKYPTSEYILLTDEGEPERKAMDSEEHLMGELTGWNKTDYRIDSRAIVFWISGVSLGLFFGEILRPIHEQGVEGTILVSRSRFTVNTCHYCTSGSSAVPMTTIQKEVLCEIQFDFLAVLVTEILASSSDRTIEFHRTEILDSRRRQEHRILLGSREQTCQSSALQISSL
ncbi:hypothetical protein HHK36_023289 [Tetracentron sinense]|uniref:Uncharacterized protein n=1 Tax=Tetracentron sinense TaxID=13715 RepID=A0A834YL13_TETSI|nr:hypothetical protein HHK36_023289 [Tetracentron sinense]